MFVVGASYISLLQSVAMQCSLPYVSTIREITEDNTALYGIEIELPAMNPFASHKRIFFWGHAQTNAAAGYEKSCFTSCSLPAVHIWLCGF